MLTSLSVMISFLGFELYCRLVIDDGYHYHLEMWKYAVELKEISENSEIGHVHRPLTNAMLMGVGVRINSFGLRNIEFDQIPKDAIRILMLGDSTTFGWGVPQNQTISAQLEKYLNQESNKTVSVINAGVGNYNTSMEVSWFQSIVDEVKPDLVIINVFINDAETTPAYKKIFWWDESLFSKVILFGAIDTAKRKTLQSPSWQEYYKSLYNDGEAGWDAMKQAMSDLSLICLSKNIPVVVADIPELRQLDPYPFRDISNKIAELAEINDLHYFSFLNSLVAEEPYKLWVSVPDPHPNENASQLMAKSLSQFLIEHNYISDF